MEISNNNEEWRVWRKLCPKARGLIPALDTLLDVLMYLGAETC